METSSNLSYMTLGLVGEVGEFTSKIAKGIRKGEYYIGKRLEGNIYFPSDNDLHYTPQLMSAQNQLEKEKELMHELGDILWFCSGIAAVMGWTLEEVAQANIDKLASRKSRGVIEGNGDNR